MIYGKGEERMKREGRGENSMNKNEADGVNETDKERMKREGSGNFDVRRIRF